MINEEISDDRIREAKSEWEKKYTSMAPTHNIIGHVIGVGIGPQFTENDEPLGANCLHFYVEKKKPMEVIKDERLRIEERYNGVPTKVMETGRLVSFQDRAPSLKAVPGSSIGLDPRDLPSNLNPALAGTLGAVVKMAGRHYILGSNHAMAVNGRAIGMQVTFRPPEGFIDDPIKSIFARVTDHVHLHSGLNEVDCALAKLEEYLDLDRIKAEFPKHLVMAEDGIPPTVNMQVARVDDSEKATGKIVSVSANPRFHFSFGAFDFKDLVLIEGDDNEENLPFARPGDSGALVVGVDKKDGKYRPIAIVIGGSRRKLRTGKWKSYTLACSFNKAIEKLTAEVQKPHAGIAQSSGAPSIKVVTTIIRGPISAPITTNHGSSLRNRRLGTRAEVAKAEPDEMVLGAN